MWPDTTTRYVTVYEGDNDAGQVAAKGVLTIRPEDFMTQLSTMKVINATSVEQRLAATARFGQFFAGALFDVFGGVVRPLDRFDSAAPMRKKRPLRVGVPEIHPFTTDDGVALRLTRYQGGSKGPVILPHLERLAILTLIHGAENACFLPAGTEKTMAVLQQRNGSHLYRRHVVPGYGHIDCIVGKRAALDVYPLILEHLDMTR